MTLGCTLPQPLPSSGSQQSPNLTQMPLWLGVGARRRPPTPQPTEMHLVKSPSQAVARVNEPLVVVLRWYKGSCVTLVQVGQTAKGSERRREIKQETEVVINMFPLVCCQSLQTPYREVILTMMTVATFIDHRPLVLRTPTSSFSSFPLLFSKKALTLHILMLLLVHEHRINLWSIF